MARDLQKRSRQKTLPRQIRKRSDRVNRDKQNLMVSGARQKTATGYIVPGFQGKSFETYYEVMLAGTATDVMRHQKKDKAFWVISGDGFLTMDTPSGSGQITRRLIPGDHINLPRGTTWRISTANQQSIEMFVSQQAKYSASLEVVEDSGAFKEATAADLREPSMAERLGEELTTRVPRRARNSKAAQQQAAMRSGRRSKQVVNADGSYQIVPEGPVEASKLGHAGSAGVNAQPTGGHFDEAGAG